MKVEECIKDVPIFCTNTEPPQQKYTLVATGNYKEIKWLSEKIAKVLK